MTKLPQRNRRKSIKPDHNIPRDSVGLLLLALKHASKHAETLGLTRVMIKLNYIYYDIYFS